MYFDGVAALAEASKPVVVLLTISNGAGHTSVAEAVADAVRAAGPSCRVLVIDVAEHMSWMARLTHVAIYLGDKQFIQSSQRVKISSLDPSSPLYDEHHSRNLLFVRRILPERLEWMAGMGMLEG